MTIDNNQAGIVLGAVGMSFNKLTIIVSSLPTISLTDVVIAGFLAFLGGILGWCGSELMNLVKSKYKKWRHDKSS